MSHPSACPSLIVHSIASSFGTGSAPGCARQIGHVCVFGAPPKPFSQRQNIFVRVFSCTWISRPMTGSHSGTSKELLRLHQRHLDVAADLEDREPLLERAVHPDHAELFLPRLERQLHVADQDCARTVEQSRTHAEDALHGEHEIRRLIHYLLHRSRSGTVSKPIASSSAWPTRKSVFSENWGPISCSPTGSASESPHGIESPGRPARFGGIVSTSARYIASGFAVFSPSLNATVGDVGLTRTSKRSNAAANSRLITVRTFCAWP